MRFLLITGGLSVLISGSATIGISTVGSIRRQGIIADLLPSGCPATMLQASNGTLLVATGLGSMLRMRRKERILTEAGVPAPLVVPRLLQDGDYSSTAGVGTKIVHFDFSQYGPVRSTRQTFFAGFSSLRLTEQGRLSLNARISQFNQYKDRIVPLPDEIFFPPHFPPGYGYSPGALLRFERLMYGFTWAPERTPASPHPQREEWDYLVFDVEVYDTTIRRAFGSTISGQYQCFQRWVDYDGNVSDPSPISSPATVTSQLYVSYANIEVPTDPRIVRRQIWRNTTGQVQNFYLDIETTDLASTEFTSSKSDTQLALSDVITFTDVDGYTIPYLYGLPPADKPYMAEFKSRISAIGFRDYYDGSCQVTNGSTTVQGIGTQWSVPMVGRLFTCGNSQYTIIEVDPATQELTIERPYQGATDNFAIYNIESYPAEKMLVRWSDLSGPEAWPTTASALLPQDGDIPTGLVVYGDALYVLKTRNIYRFSFSEDPAIDGEIYPACKGRGCINQSCAVTVEGACYMLDREGIHAFTGGPNPSQVSGPITDLWREDTDGLRLNWNAHTCMWHAVVHQEIGTIKWYVALAGSLYPRHAICYDYRKQRFWIEEYPRPITASCMSLAITGRPLLGTSESKILAADSGSLDLIEAGGTLLEIESVNSPFSLTLAEEPKTCLGVPAVIVNGQSAGTDRVITYQNGAEIQFGTPMDILPQKGDKVQLGGIKYKLVTGAFDADMMEGQQPISMAAYVDPNSSTPLYATLTIYKDGLASPATMVAARATWGAASKSRTVSTKQIALDMSTSMGVVKENLDAQKEKDAPLDYSFQFRFDGSSGESRPVINEIAVTGAG
jgi:hypothetical protein